MKTVRLQKIYPCLFTDQSEVFGSVDNNGSWRDGIFTGLLRKTIKVTDRDKCKVIDNKRLLIKINLLWIEILNDFSNIINRLI